MTSNIPIFRLRRIHEQHEDEFILDDLNTLLELAKKSHKLSLNSYWMNLYQFSYCV